MRITFCGAAESVTGSCHLIETEGENALSFLLDCGQFQGSATQEKKNYDPFPFDPAKIGFLILSHAHIDHCGRIPLLVKQGFQGRIYCTSATADLLPIMLRDCAHIQEKEAEWKNRKAQRAGRELITPLYTMEDAEASLTYITPVLYDQEIAPDDRVRFSFADAGHILGSAITQVWVREDAGETLVVFSGDLGVDSMPLLRDPVKIRQADVVLMETTYGARLHEKHEPSLERLMEIIDRTAKRGGTVVIPSFAVGRTQELIYELNKYYEGKDAEAKFLNGIMVYIDSPMASAATEVFRGNIQDFDEEYKARVMAGDDPLDFANLVFTRSTDESKALNENSSPKIIISASGMCDAGRILHHLKHRLWDPKSTVVFVGYQSEGTLGRRLVEGAKTVSILGEAVNVNADVISLEGFSAHADRDGLLEWARGFAAPPKSLFLVHGEADAKAAFSKTLHDEAGMDSIVIEDYCTYIIEPGRKARKKGEAAETDDEAGNTGKAGDTDTGGNTDTGGAGRDADVDPEDMERLLSKLRNVNDNVEGLLYRAKLAAVEAADGGDKEKYTALKNVIASLETDTSKLAGALAERKRDQQGPDV